MQVLCCDTTMLSSTVYTKQQEAPGTIPVSYCEPTELGKVDAFEDTQPLRYTFRLVS